MAFRYYKVFKFMQPDNPRGLLIFNREGNRLDTIAWNHFTKRWEHDPDAVMSYVMGDDRGKHAEINRGEAEEIARTILLTTLPSEPELMSISDEAERQRAERFGT